MPAVQLVCRVVVVAATSRGRRFPAWIRGFLALTGSALAAGGARAVDLPEDTVEALYHSYNGGGVNATGPALLVRKRLNDKISLSASYYVDAVSNASIDVVTTASPYRETRTEYGFGTDYVYRDSRVNIAASSSKEGDYSANRLGMDISQETFSGMTTVSMGFTRGSDQIGKTGAAEFAESAGHWQYRLGLTQILSPRWLASVNMEALSDSGFLGSPYRVARVFGAAVAERTPRTRSARAVKFRVNGDLGARNAIHLDYRYYLDTWDIKAHTVEAGYSQHLGSKWLLDGWLRQHRQDKALFYSDNANTETSYVSRNRQLGTFDSMALGAKAAYTTGLFADKHVVSLNAAYEYTQYRFADFTDVRTAKPYAYNASVFQFFAIANF